MRSASAIIKHHKQFIPNAWDTGNTNARAEATSRLIKEIKRRACGFANFDNMRKRLLASLGRPRPKRRRS